MIWHRFESTMMWHSSAKRQGQRLRRRLQKLCRVPLRDTAKINLATFDGVIPAIGSQCRGEYFLSK